MSLIQRRSQEFDLGGYKWVKETKQPHKKIKVDWFGGIYTDIPRRCAPVDAEVFNVYTRFVLFQISYIRRYISSWF